MSAIIVISCSSHSCYIFTLLDCSIMCTWLVQIAVTVIHCWNVYSWLTPCSTCSYILEASAWQYCCNSVTLMHFIVCMYIQILQNDVEFTGDVVVTEEMEESSTFKFISSSSSHKEMVLKYLGNYIFVLVDSFFFHIFF